MMPTRRFVNHLAMDVFPSVAWVVLISTMLFSLCPSPIQSFLRSLFMRGKLLHPSSSPPVRANLNCCCCCPFFEKFTVPQSYFLHFYILGAVCNTFFLSLSLFLACTCEKPLFELERREAWRIVFLLMLLELQLLRRLYESLYVSKFSAMARMHVLAYLLGLLYYVLAPLSLFPRAREMIMKTTQCFGAYKQGINKLKDDNQGWHSMRPLLDIGWTYWIGGAIFIWGWIHQYRCHMILASLRSKKGLNKEDTHAYKIPYGDWFEYVSSAHYFAEIVMYFAFVVATAGLSLDAWLLFIFVVLNLSVVAVDTHRWYTAKFDDYPSSRRAIIPFMF